MSESQLSPVFVGGHRKCGTTMLLNLFDGHPDLCVFPVDLKVLYAYFPDYDSREVDLGRRKDRLDTVVFNHWESLPELAGKIDAKAFRAIFLRRMGSSSYNIQEIVRELLLAYRELIGAAYQPGQATVVKETSIEIYANHVFEWFPNAKLIHLIRDPRDTYSALKSGIESYYSRLGDDEHTVLHSLLERCHLGMQLADINQSRFGADNYLVVRFEDIVTDAVNSLKAIAEFLGIDYEEALLVPTVLGSPTRGNNFEKMDFPQVSRSNVARWPERILPGEAKVIEFHFKDLMNRFGYELAYSETEQADGATEFYKWSNYKYHYSDPFQIPVG